MSSRAFRRPKDSVGKNGHVGVRESTVREAFLVPADLQTNFATKVDVFGSLFTYTPTDCIVRKDGREYNAEDFLTFLGDRPNRFVAPKRNHKLTEPISLSVHNEYMPQLKLLSTVAKSITQCLTKPYVIKETTTVALVLEAFLAAQVVYGGAKTRISTIMMIVINDLIKRDVVYKIVETTLADIFYAVWGACEATSDMGVFACVRRMFRTRGTCEICSVSMLDVLRGSRHPGYMRTPVLHNAEPDHVDEDGLHIAYPHRVRCGEEAIWYYDSCHIPLDGGEEVLDVSTMFDRASNAFKNELSEGQHVIYHPEEGQSHRHLRILPAVRFLIAVPVISSLKTINMGTDALNVSGVENEVLFYCLRMFRKIAKSTVGIARFKATFLPDMAVPVGGIEDALEHPFAIRALNAYKYMMEHAALPTDMYRMLTKRYGRKIMDADDPDLWPYACIFIDSQDASLHTWKFHQTFEEAGIVHEEICDRLRTLTAEMPQEPMENTVYEAPAPPDDQELHGLPEVEEAIPSADRPDSDYIVIEEDANGNQILVPKGSGAVDSMSQASTNTVRQVAPGKDMSRFRIIPISINDVVSTSSVRSRPFDVVELLRDMLYQRIIGMPLLATNLMALTSAIESADMADILKLYMNGFSVESAAVYCD